jgi:hypothetical protein
MTLLFHQIAGEVTLQIFCSSSPILTSYLRLLVREKHLEGRNKKSAGKFTSLMNKGLDLTGILADDCKHGVLNPRCGTSAGLRSGTSAGNSRSLSRAKSGLFRTKTPDTHGEDQLEEDETNEHEKAILLDFVCGHEEGYPYEDEDEV